MLHAKQILEKQIMAYVDVAPNSNEINSSLIIFTRKHITGSFFPKMKELCFRHHMSMRIGHVDNNCFSESENSDLTRDTAGPKQNHKLHVATDATTNHMKKVFICKANVSIVIVCNLIKILLMIQASINAK